MNPRSRRAALYTIATVAVLASINALAHSYVGLYGWAKTHGMTGWQATTWPAEVDVFLIIGELALYIAYLDLWPTRHKTWPWTTAVVGLTISIAGNVGHIHATPGSAAITARLTAATSPLAAFAGLAIALLVLKRTRPAASPARPPATPTVTPAALLLMATQLSSSRAVTIHAASSGHKPILRLATPTLSTVQNGPIASTPADSEDSPTRPPTEAGPAPAEQSLLLSDARDILQKANRAGVRLTQRRLANELRDRGHHVANANLKHISTSIGLPLSATPDRRREASRPRTRRGFHVPHEAASFRASQRIARDAPARPRQCADQLRTSGKRVTFDSAQQAVIIPVQELSGRRSSGRADASSHTSRGAGSSSTSSGLG